MIGCEQTGRRCFMMELDPLYADVIVTRWEKFTGKTAERIAGGGAGTENTPAESAGVEGGAS